MKVPVVGTDYVGLVTRACLAEMGNDVPCLDVDLLQLQTPQHGGIPIHQPWLGVVVCRNAAAGWLAFTTEVENPALVKSSGIKYMAIGRGHDTSLAAHG